MAKILKISVLIIALLVIPATVFGLTVTLTWTAGDTTQTGFNVYREPILNTPPSSWTKLGTSTLPTFQDTTASPGNCYAVTAFNANGESVPSNVACVPIVPKPPGGLIVVIVVAP